MSVTRLHPVTLPKVDVSDADRVTAALHQAMEDHKLDIGLGQSARGIAIVFFREHPDGTFGESYIVQGLNTMETIGLLHLTAHDIGEQGLDGGPDHFPKEPI